VKQTKRQTSSSDRTDAKQPAEVVIELEPMVSRDPIIWNRRRYDYVFKVAHINSGQKPWHIYCCEEQIPWVCDAMQSQLVLTQGHDFTDESKCKVVGGELCGSHLGRTILHQGLFEDDELDEVEPLESESDFVRLSRERCLEFCQVFDFVKHKKPDIPDTVLGAWISGCKISHEMGKL
tara:strand:- start:342 stop:875 length:534 start_codon:yes stop_codon:yes gene_type:complete